MVDIRGKINLAFTLFDYFEEACNEFDGYESASVCVGYQEGAYEEVIYINQSIPSTPKFLQFKNRCQTILGGSSLMIHILDIQEHHWPYYRRIIYRHGEWEHHEYKNPITEFVGIDEFLSRGLSIWKAGTTILRFGGSTLNVGDLNIVIGKENDGDGSGDPETLMTNVDPCRVEIVENNDKFDVHINRNYNGIWRSMLIKMRNWVVDNLEPIYLYDVQHPVAVPVELFNSWKN